MGVMVFSLSLYGEAWAESAGAASEGAEAMRGLGRLGAGLLAVPIFLLLGMPLLRAVVELRRWFATESLILLGVTAAMGVSLWNTATDRGDVYYETATMVLVLVTLGRWLDSSAKTRARERLSGLLAARVREVTVLDRGVESVVDAAHVEVGDLLRVRPGEVVGADGVVVEGEALVDGSMLTGEATPRPARPGDEVLAGSLATDSALLLRVTRTGDERLCVRSAQLLEESLGNRGASLRVADRVAALLMPTALVLATWTVASRWSSVGAEEALLDGLSVILISCPCALGIATPLAFWVAMGEAWKRGILVRGSDVFEDLAGVRQVFFDKTGTLTTGELALDAIELDDPTADRRGVLRTAAALEASSEHGIARAVERAWSEGAKDDGPLPAVQGFRVLPGRGVTGEIAGVSWSLLRHEDAEDDARTRVVLQRAETLVAVFSFTSVVRPEAARVLADLGRAGITASVLTGDGEGPARALARELSVDVHAKLSPTEKRDRVVAAGAKTAFVGDGWNDGAALAAAGVGVSVANCVGQSLERASVNLLEPGLSRLPWLFRMARWARANARANLAWAVGYNAIGMTLAAQGRLTPVFAAAIMVTSSIAVVLQAQRSAPSFEESAREARGAGPAQGEGSFSSQETARWSEGSPPTVRSSTVSQLDGANT